MIHIRIFQESSAPPDLAARNVTRNEPIMGLFSYFFPKLNKYIGNIKIVLTYSNTWLEIAGLSSTKNKLKSA